MKRDHVGEQKPPAVRRSPTRTASITRPALFGQANHCGMDLGQAVRGTAIVSAISIEKGPQAALANALRLIIRAATGCFILSNSLIEGITDKLSHY